MKKNIKKITKKKKRAVRKKSAYSKVFSMIRKKTKKSFSLGLLKPGQAKVAVLASLIIMFGYLVFIQQYAYHNFFVQKDLSGQKTAEEIRMENFKKELLSLVKGHPIEAMVPYIAEKDRETAAYLIGIAKKESNWGKRKPVLEGEDCYNYWGFRLRRERMGSGGHTCFDNPRQAVNVVAMRIDEIIERNDARSASDMVVWKCGSNCAVTGGEAAADKWIRDVDFYAKKVLN